MNSSQPWNGAVGRDDGRHGNQSEPRLSHAVQPPDLRPPATEKSGVATAVASTAPESAPSLSYLRSSDCALTAASRDMPPEIVPTRTRTSRFVSSRMRRGE